MLWNVPMKMNDRFSFKIIVSLDPLSSCSDDISYLAAGVVEGNTATHHTAVSPNRLQAVRRSLAARGHPHSVRRPLAAPGRLRAVHLRIASFDQLAAHILAAPSKGEAENKHYFQKPTLQFLS